MTEPCLKRLSVGVVAVFVTNSTVCLPRCAEMCRYHQTSSQSHFTKARICSRATTDGRITLSGLRLITSADDGLRQERILTNDEEYATILRDHFGIVMAS